MNSVEIYMQNNMNKNTSYRAKFTLIFNFIYLYAIVIN